MHHALRVLALVFAVPGCGSLANGDDPGVPAIEVDGIATGLVQQQLVAPSVAIVWVDVTDGQFSVTTDVAPIAATTLSSAFVLDVFDPPTDGISVLTNSSGLADAELGFGYLFAFDDVDRSGTWSFDDSDSGSIAPDAFIGLADTAVLFVKTAPSPGSEFFQAQVSASDPDALFASADQLTAGYHLIQRVCTGGVPVGTAHYVIVDATTVADMTLFAPSATLPATSDCSISP